MTMQNPITTLDLWLADYASPKTRRTIHAILSLSLALLGIWMAVEGNWREFVATIVALVYAEANKANTPPVPEQPPVTAEEHAAWEEQPTHVDEIVPRTTEHDASDLYGDGADRGVSGNPDTFDAPRINPPNRGWQ